MLKDIDRLSNEQFFTPTLPFQISRRTQVEPYPLHWHEFYELTFIISGQGIHKVNGTEILIQPGDLWLLTPADFHEIGPAPDTELEKYNLIFTDKFLSDELRNLLFQNIRGYTSAAFEGALAKRIELDLAWIVEEQQRVQLATMLMVKATLERLLIGLIRKNTLRQTAAPLESVQQSIQRAIAYIHHHFREPLDLNEVAAQVGLSPSYFSSCFHKAAGVTFRRYILQLRLHLASSLFMAGKRSVTEVCFACGFNTLNYFEKTFREEFGMTPREYVKGEQ